MYNYKEISEKIVSLLSFGLVKGLGIQQPGEMCIEAVVCHAMGLPHSDNPPCVGSAFRSYKIVLNDANWSSNEARAKGMASLALAQLGSNTLNQIEFAKKLALATVNILLADLLNEMGFSKEALNCRNANNLKIAARAAAADTARDATAAAYAAARAAAADTACDAATYAAYAATYAAADKWLILSAKIATDILIEMKSPGCEFLYLVNTK